MQRIGVVGGLVGHMTRARGAKGRGWFTKAMAQMEQAGDDEPPQPYPATPLHGKDRKKAFLSLQTANAKPQKVVLELIVSGYWCPGALGVLGVPFTTISFLLCLFRMTFAQ